MAHTPQIRRDRERSSVLVAAYGLRIRSALLLPFDSLAAADVADAADVTVRLGSVPSSLPGRLTRTVLWQARPGALLLHVEGVARYLIADGRDVYIEPLGNDHADASFVAGMPLTVRRSRRARNSPQYFKPAEGRPSV